MNKDKKLKGEKKPKEKPLIIKGTLDDVLKASVKKPKDKK